MAGDPKAVRVGPGKLYIAPVGSTEPSDLSTAWDAAWVELGYTNEGSSFTFDNTFEDVEVEEELDPISTLQTARQINVAFASAELTAANLQTALNGGDIDTTTGIVTFEPPPAGEFTPVAIGWESDDAFERWIFRNCIQVGNVEIQRRRAPQKAVLPMQFRANVPADGSPTFKFIHDEDYTAGA